MLQCLRLRLCRLGRFGIIRLNFCTQIPDAVIQPKTFPTRTFFARLHVRYLDCSINQDCLLGYSIHQFDFATFQGQRNPLTAEMSSEICDKISLTIIIAQILTRILFESIKIKTMFAFFYPI